MLEFLFLIIGLVFVVYVTILFIRSLRTKDGRTKSKIWQWVKNVLDAISGI